MNSTCQTFALVSNTVCFRLDFYMLIWRICSLICLHFIFFAPVVLNYLSRFNFLMIYFVSLIAGSLLTLYFHKNEPNFRAVGASGAVTGIIYSAILLNPNMSLYIFFIPIPIPAYLFGIGYLVYSIYGMRQRVGNIGHSAHFGGAIGGFATTLLFNPFLLKTQPLMIGLLVLPIVVMFILHKQKKI